MADDKREAYKLTLILSGCLAIAFLFTIVNQVLGGLDNGEVAPRMARVTRIEVDNGKSRIYGKINSSQEEVQISGASSAKVGSLVEVEGTDRGGAVAAKGHNQQLLIGRCICFVVLLIAGVRSATKLWPYRRSNHLS